MAKPCKYTLKDGTVLDFDQARQYVMDNIADLIKDSPTLKAQYDATTKGKVEEGDKPEYKEGAEGGKTAEAGGGNRPVTSSITEEQGTEEVKTPSVYATLADKARAKIKELQDSKKPYDPNNPKPYLASSSFIPVDAHIAALEAFAKVMDGVNELSEAYTSGATLKEAVKAGLDAMRSHPDFKAMDSEDKQSAIDEYNEEYSEAAIPMEDDLNPEGYAEGQKYSKNRVSKIVQRALQGGSLSKELAAIIGQNENADGSFVWAEESVHIKDVAKIIDELIEKLGPNGISKMMDIASDVRIPAWFRALTAGKINDILYLQERAAQTKADKDIAIDRAVSMISVIAGIGEEAGRTLRFIQEVYRQSPIAYARSVKNKIDVAINTEETQRKNALMLENIANIINGKESENTSPQEAEKARAEEVTETAAAAADQVLNDDVKTKEDVIIGLEAELAGIDADIAALEAQIAEERANKKRGKGKGGAPSSIPSGIRNLFSAPQPSDLQKKLAELKAKKKEIEAKVKVMKTEAAAEKKIKSQKNKEQLSNKQKISQALKDAGYVTPGGLVDWNGIIGNPNTSVEAKQAIYDKIKEVSGEDAANQMKPQLDAVYDKMIAEKKLKAIDKILKAQGKPPVKRGHLPSVVYKLNRLIALNGSATGANVQSAIGHLLGTTSITPQQSARLDELSQSYFNAPNGYLRAAELERMTHYVDRISKGMGRYIIATLHQHFVAGLISGVLTGLKNATVGLDLAFGIGTEYARSGFDSNVLKSALYGMKEGLVIGRTVIGKGYAGRTISAIDVQQGGKQNMSPRIAEFVFDLVPDTRMGRNVVRASNLWNVAKYMSRSNEGVDSLFGSVSANMTKYVMLKDYYKDQGMSRNAAGAAAYTDLYVTEEMFNDAMEQARGEIANMSISPSENMVKRRAYEIIDENREIPQSTKDLAEEAANQLTYKKPGLYGITHALPFIVHSISRSLDKFSQSKHLNPKVAGALAEAGKYGLNTIVPFAGIGANVTEAGLDWLPIYGTTKMAGGILNYHAFTKDKTGEKAVKLKVALRQIYAKQAVTITVSAYVFAMLLAGDDDDEKEIMAYFDLVKGTGGKYVRKNPIPGEEKDRTILGVSLDITASLQTALLVIADYRQQVEENPDYTNMDLLQYAVNAYKTAVLASSILKSGAEIIDLLDNIGVVDKSKFLSKKAAQVLANSFLPATGMAKQGGDLKSPVKKEAIGFFDNIMNEGGIYTTWAIDREKFDWRGRPYATGDFYASNPRAFTTNMGITKNILKADDIDKWAINKNVKTVGPKTDNDKEEDQFRYSLIVPETPGNAPFRFMDNYEVYDFNKRAAQLFNKEITEYWGSDRDVMIAATEKEAQEIVSLIWGRAKERSFYELNLKVNPRLSETYSEQEFKDRMNRVEKEPERSKDVGKLEFRIKKKPIFE